MSHVSVPEEPNMLDHALAYARVGLPVLPLGARSKIPIKKSGGKDDATTDPDVIRAWWSADPLRNIGICPPDGVVVVDVDPRNGGSLDVLGELPETWTAATGGGGWHKWFRCAGKVRGKLDGVAGVDLKSHSGYVVAPPSIHESGTAYRWLNAAPITVLPAHLRDRVRRPLIPPRVTDKGRGSFGGNGVGLVRYVERAQEGDRNRALFWAASQAFREGGDAKLLHALVVAAAGIGLPYPEIERTLRSAERSNT